MEVTQHRSFSVAVAATGRHRHVLPSALQKIQNPAGLEARFTGRHDACPTRSTFGNHQSAFHPSIHPFIHLSNNPFRLSRAAAY
jgi:hypothetical protein